MDSEIFEKLPPTKLFFRCAIPSMITMAFGTLIFPIGFLFVLSPIFQLKGVWLSAFFSCTASAAVTVILALTMRKKKSDFGIS